MFKKSIVLYVLLLTPTILSALYAFDISPYDDCVIYISEASTVYIHPPLVTKLITWHRVTDFFGRETRWLKKLAPVSFIPKLISCNHEQKSMVMTYAGEALTKENMPHDWRDQVAIILRTLKAYHCSHNDIKPTNLCLLNGKIQLIDFGWSTTIGAKMPCSWEKNGKRKKKHYYTNDHDALHKAIQTILQKK